MQLAVHPAWSYGAVQHDIKLYVQETDMRKFAILLALAISAPVIAQDAAPAVATAPVAATAIHKGQSIKDAKGTRLGSVDKITTADGALVSVQIIAGSRFATIPANQLVLTNGNLSTTLTKAEVNKLP